MYCHEPGYIGYDLQNGIREELLNRGIYRTVSTVLTQVIVDPYDDAFYTPTKVLGRYMNAEEANEERKKGNFVVEEPGKGFRRAVSAPNPVKIVELDAVKALLDADQIVIAAGGGGIPVLEQDNHLRGASAVIEKDLAAGKLAEGINADLLIILTNVEKYVSTLANRMRNHWIQLLLIRQKLTWKRDILEFTTCFQNSVQLLNS